VRLIVLYIYILCYLFTSKCTYVYANRLHSAAGCLPKGFMLPVDDVRSCGCVKHGDPKSPINCHLNGKFIYPSGINMLLSCILVVWPPILNPIFQAHSHDVFLGKSHAVQVTFGRRRTLSSKAAYGWWTSMRFFGMNPGTENGPRFSKNSTRPGKHTKKLIGKS
jgi:hypothetical protein